MDYIGFSAETDQIFLRQHGWLLGAFGFSPSVFVGKQEVMTEILGLANAEWGTDIPVVPLDGAVKERIDRCVEEGVLKLLPVTCVEEYRVFMDQGHDWMKEMTHKINACGYIVKGEEYISLHHKVDGKWVTAIEFHNGGNAYKSFTAALTWAQENNLKSPQGVIEL